MSPTKKRSDTPSKKPVRATAKPAAAGQPSPKRAAAPEPGTRSRILAYLSEKRMASTAEISRAWGLTPADIRYHLSLLLAEGFIEIVPRDPDLPTRRGRPTQFYRLALQSQPNNLPALCHALLCLLPAQTEFTQQSAVYQTLAKALAGDFTPPTNLIRRFNQVVEWLNQAQYNARWEAGAQGPRILLRACPYAAVLTQHPELCQIDQTLLEHLLQVQLRQTTRQNLATGKPPACIFVIR